jgi:dephospho-CoA kinase
MLNVGLTGGIACGKSTVARMFVMLGAHLIDFDKLAHEVQEPECPAWKDIIKHFGKGILKQDETIDRNKLAQIVFADKKELQVLNDIVHPHVFKLWQKRLDKIKKNEEHAIVLSDVPLLFEEKTQNLFDLTILVLIPPEKQISRLMARNKMSREEALLRLKSQLPIADKIELADIVIDNQENVSQTEKKVAQIWRQLKEREKSKKINSRPVPRWIS